MSTILDPAKLKVVELRSELGSRGLDTKGVKAALVKRLREALEAESGEDVPETSIADTSTEDLNTTSSSQPSPKAPVRESTPEPPPVVESSPKTRTRSRRSEEHSEKHDVIRLPEPVVHLEQLSYEKMETSTPVELEKETESVELSKTASNEDVEQMQEDSAADVSEPEETSNKMDKDVEMKASEDQHQEEQSNDADMPEEQTNGDTAINQGTVEPEKEPPEPRNRKSRWGSIAETEPPTDVSQIESIGDNQADKTAATTRTEDNAGTAVRGEKRRHGSPSPERATRKRSRSPIKEDEPEIDLDKVLLSWIDSDLNLQVNKDNFTIAEPLHSDGFGYMWAGVRSTHGIQTGKVWYEVKLLENCEWKEAPKDDRKEKEKDKDKEKEKEKDKDKEKENDKQKEKDNDNDKEEDKEPEEENDVEMEKEKIEEKDKEEIEEKEEEKVEEKETEKMEEKKTEKIEEKEPEEIEEKETEKIEEDKEKTVPESTHVFRVGWSLPNTDLQLGEQSYSYGYDSEGFSVTDSTFTEYGTSYSCGDVVGAFLNMDDDKISITYTVNGELQPIAFTIPRSELPDEGEEAALFGHVLTRNIKFEINFGQNDEPWFEPPAELADYKFLQEVEEKIAGLSRPEKRQDCEVLMMVGLPCSGKTHWVNNHISENLEKRYNVIGLTNVLDKMKHCGKPRKETFKGSVTSLMDKCVRCVNRLVDMAALRRRNWILDQTNLFSSAQRRKMRPFDGFQRRAIVIVPSDDEQNAREKQRQQADGKDVPDSAVLEMKANMSLPTTCDWLEEVTYGELDETKAKELVQKFNKQGREAGYGPNYAKQHQNIKNLKGLSGNDRRGGGGSGGGQWNRNNKRDHRDNRNNRWGGGGSGGGGGHGGRPNNWGGSNRSGGGGGGWGRHDDRNHHHRGGSGGGGGGGYRNSSNNRMMTGGGGYNRNDSGSRGGGGYNRNRNQPHNRNQMASKGGNWGGQGGGSGSNWSGQGGWGSQAGWGGHQSSGQAAAGSGWSQGNWSQYGGSQGGGSGGQTWKGGYGSGSGQQYQQGGGSGGTGYAQGYGAGQYGAQQYPGQYYGQYYGQYAQGWNAQGQQGGGGGSSSDAASQYSSYAQQAWAQYASTGGGGYGTSSAGYGAGGTTGTAGAGTNQQTNSTNSSSAANKPST